MPLLAALLGSMITVVPAAPAQTAGRRVDSRFLLIFDTSSEMKHCLPAVRQTVNGFLSASAIDQLNTNDTLGVWTFDQELHTGQFPLQRWRPDFAAEITSNINAFVSSQRYTKKTTFGALFPLLDQVVRSSERLTVVIFCDGEGEIHGTPYDAGINQIFQQRRSERRKARLPFVIAIRSQFGKYVDCMVSFPPQSVSLPVFPPLPAPAPVTPKVASAPPAAPPPRATVPPLIIIGTPPTNRVPPPPPKPEPTNATASTETSPPPSLPAGEPTLPAVEPSAPTNAISPQLTIAPALLSQTNTEASPSAGTGISRTEAFFLGVGFLVVAGGLATFLFRRNLRGGGGSPPVG